MGSYKKAVITKKGQNILAEALANNAKIQFSKVDTSGDLYPEGTDLAVQETMPGIKQSVIPSAVRVINGSVISIQALFGNEEITEAYLIQNVGVYVSYQGEEFLFAIIQAIVPDQMPAYSGVAPSSFIYNISLAISQASSLNLEVNTAGVATIAELNAVYVRLESVEQAVDRLYDTPIPVTLTAAGWTGDDVPYVQTAVAEGILATDNPGLVSMLADGATEAVQKAYAKAFGIISSGTGTTGDGTATFKVYKKPATDITVGLKL